MKHIAILFALIISALLHNTSLLAQDSTRIPIPDSIRYAAFDTNIIAGTNRLSNNSEVFSYNEYIWSDKRSLSEILEMRGGFKVYNYGFGQHNVISEYTFRGLTGTGLYRDGFPINSSDPEIISINEIDSIELISAISSMLYTTGYSTGIVNIISKDVIQPQAFSQLRYSQDRYDGLFADVYFSQSFSKKFNLQFGLTKGSNAGRYTNSDYDKWQTRTKLNFFLNPNFNIKFNFYYNNIERGLFQGLVSDTSTTVKDDSLRQALDNIYVNGGFYLKLFSNKNNLTKVLFDYKNSLDKRLNFFTGTPSFHELIYNFNLNQNFNVKISNAITSNLIVEGKFSLTKSRDNDNNIAENKSFSGFAKYDLFFNSFDISVFFKQSHTNYQNEIINNYSSPGVEGNYYILKTPDINLNLYGGMNYSGRNWNVNDKPLNFYNYQTGFDINYKNMLAKFRYRRGISNNETKLNLPAFEIQYVSYLYDSYNINLKFKIWDMVFDLVNDYYIFSSDNVNYFRGNIFYENKFFNNNLDLKTGFIVKQYHNLFFSTVGYDSNDDFTRDVFNLDFYIGARIGSANINFTLANLFNRINYDTYLYPYDDRGGFANVVSRFTIVWDFLN